MGSSETDPLILVAAITGAFGVRGEVRLKSFTADPKACAGYGPLLDENGKTILTPKSVRAIKNGVAVQSEEITNPEDANALKSTALYVRRSVLPDTEEDEFYHSDLIGLNVETIDGVDEGKVKTLRDFGAGDILEIKPEKGPSWFLPFTREDVPIVDIKAGKLVIKKPEILPDQTKEKS